MLNYDRLACDYARHRQAHPEVIRDLLTFGRLTSGSAVLDVGCGTGNYIAALQAICGCSCWGVDPSAEMLSIAAARCGEATLNVGRSERLDFPGGFFDLVFSVDVIHHVGDRLSYFSEAYRVLRKGGRVCTVTDSDWIIQHRQPLALYFPGDGRG